MKLLKVINAVVEILLLAEFSCPRFYLLGDNITSYAVDGRKPADTPQDWMEGV